MEQTVYILPTFWASALINNDRSGLDNYDCKVLDRWISKTNPGNCVQVSEDTWYARKNDAFTLGGEVAAYTFTKQ